MPTLNWIGKDAVVHHHEEVPFHLLRCDDALSVGEPGSGNLLVQGDNLTALKALLPYYAGKVKCIYIDPPYNTGNEGWSYNDNVNSPEIRAWLGAVVGKEAEDLSRHDKWLSMMYPRLTLLRDLLSEDGVIFVSINSVALGYLKLLLDEIFGPANLIEVFVWETEGHTENQEDVSSVHEYILAYAGNRSCVILNNIVDPNVPTDSKIRRDFAENSITKNGAKNPASVVELPAGFPCEVQILALPAFTHFNELQEAVETNGNWISRSITQQFQTRYPVLIDPLSVQDYKLTKNCRVYTGWSSLNKLQRFIGAGCKPFEDGDSMLSFFLSKNGVIYYHRQGRQSKYIHSVLRNLGTTEKNRNELEAMGLQFTYPKPRELIGYLISMVAEDGDIVLDSFAGSGTTGHAVMQKNADGMNRLRFVLVELEASVAEEVTQPRLEKITNGYLPKRSKRWVPGLGGGFRYCRLGPTLFDADGQIRGDVTYDELARHVFFSETGEPLTGMPAPPLVGFHKGSAVYLLFNGVLGDARPEGGNLLTRQVLAQLPAHDGPKVIYAEGCTLSADYLTRHRITFRQTPYQIRVR